MWREGTVLYMLRDFKTICNPEFFKEADKDPECLTKKFAYSYQLEQIPFE